MNNRIVIITPFYNPGVFLEQCVASIMTQKYDNFHVVFVDDASTDGAFDRLPKGDPRVTIVRNAERKTALENLHDAIINHCQPNDIAVLVDGDDWLPNKKVLEFINDFYNQNDCWIMYGQARWTDGNPGCSYPYPDENYFNSIRNAQILESGQPTGYLISHIRTFRAGLYHKIQEQDTFFSCLRDTQGKFYRMTYDVAMMLPMLEMAGFDKVKFNDKVLYTYNRGNPISDDRVNQKLQWDIHAEIYKKPKFKKIESYL
jgi:glycosyltransferase involved in cell wall biosynthesis